MDHFDIVKFSVSEFHIKKLTAKLVHVSVANRSFHAEFVQKIEETFHQLRFAKKANDQNDAILYYTIIN